MISPLLSLIQDQVISLRSKGIEADYLDSQRSPSDVDAVIKSTYLTKLLHDKSFFLQFIEICDKVN